MNFHAGAPRVSENGVNSLAFQAGNENLAAGHAGPNFCALGRALLAACGCFGAHVSCAFVTGGRGLIKKPTTVASRGCLSKFCLFSTSANGLVAYDDQQQFDLSNLWHW